MTSEATSGPLSPGLTVTVPAPCNAGEVVALEVQVVVDGVARRRVDEVGLDAAGRQLAHCRRCCGSSADVDQAVVEHQPLDRGAWLGIEVHPRSVCIADRPAAAGLSRERPARRSPAVARARRGPGRRPRGRRAREIPLGTITTSVRGHDEVVVDVDILAGDARIGPRSCGSQAPGRAAPATADSPGSANDCLICHWSCVSGAAGSVIAAIRPPGVLGVEQDVPPGVLERSRGVARGIDHGPKSLGLGEPVGSWRGSARSPGPTSPLHPPSRASSRR